MATQVSQDAEHNIQVSSLS